MLLFDTRLDIDICLSQCTDTAIRLAAKDLQRDLRLISGKKDGFAVTNEELPRSITVKVTGGEAESYTVKVTADGVLIEGADTLGAVFGIYAFSRYCLGFSPSYRVTDVLPERRTAIALPESVFASKARCTRFRGWFLNDEDLLTEYKISGGKRDIDYPFYGNVMDTDVLDLILETALRHEINLIIPSSFVDISNPDEEKLVEATVRRGLYISQHHVEPLGVSYFGADNYLKRRGYKNETVSFLSNRARMEEIWRFYAEKWAKYGDRVIWQLGLRGKADQSVWRTDPTVPNSGEARGAIISDAIATEHRIIREALGRDDFVSTATLWMEGAELYGKGYITLPSGTVAVFSDIGYSQAFGDDFYTTPRRAGERYGIYYHVGFWGEGPHLAEGCDPRKMANAYRDAKQKDSLYYSILNVSNLRPLHIGASVNAKYLAAPTALSAKEAVREVLTEILGKEAEPFEALLWEYYATLADLGEEWLRIRCKRAEFYYRPAGSDEYPAFPVTDGVLRSIGYWTLSNVDSYDALDTAPIRKSLSRWAALREKATAYKKTLHGQALGYFERFLGFEIIYMHELSRWLVAALDMTKAVGMAQREACHQTACAALEAILRERGVLEEGGWENWHRGDKKIDILGLLEKTNAYFRKDNEG